MHSAAGDMEFPLQAWRPGLDAAFENSERHDPADGTSLMGLYLREIEQGLLEPVCGEDEGTGALTDSADVLCDIEADQHWPANGDENVGDYSSSGERSLCDNLFWDADTVEKILSSNPHKNEFMEMDAPQGDDSSDGVTEGVRRENAASQHRLIAAADYNMAYSARCAGPAATHKLTGEIGDSWHTAKQTDLSTMGQTIFSSMMEDHEDFFVTERQDDCINWSDSKASNDSSNTENVDTIACKGLLEDEDEGGGVSDLGMGKGASKQTRIWGIGCREPLSRQSSGEMKECKTGADISMMSEYTCGQSSRGNAEEQGKRRQQGWGCGGAATKSASAPASKNLVSERMRRQKLNEKLYTLRALVPNISKMNKASIVGDAIEYLKDLKKQIEDAELEIGKLEACKEQLKKDIPCPMPLCKGKHQIMKWSCKKRTKLVHKILELDVTSMEGRLFQFRIHCKKSPGVVLQLARALETLDIHIINGNMTSINDRILSTLVIEVNESHLMKSEDLRKQALEAIQKFGILLAKNI